MTADHKFAMEAAMGGMMEVELGRLAAEKGASDEVRQFGQRMVTTTRRPTRS
jgi:putative membrane protein